MQKAKDIMTRNPRCISQEGTVTEAVTIMRREDCGVVPVVESSGRCIGIVTDRDICLRVVLDGLDPRQTQVSQVMSSNPLTVRPDEPMDAVIRRMEERQVRRVPVVDEADKPVGIIAERDIALKERDKGMVEGLVEAIRK